MTNDRQTVSTDDAHSRELEARFRRNLKAQKRNAVMMRVGLNIAGVVIALILWELTRFLPGVNEVLFPPPSIVASEVIPMIVSGEIPNNILVSLKRAGLGFAVAAVLGVATGVLTARLSVFNFLTEPLLHGARSLPAIALVPISVLWFGIGEAAKIALVCWGAFFPIWVSTFIGVRDVHPIYLRSAACLGAGRAQTLLWVILPAALPMILAGLRQSIAISLIVLVAAELSGATSGVAYMMSMGHQLFRVDIMFIGLFLLAALGFLADRLFVALTRKLFPWYASGH